MNETYTPVKEWSRFSVEIPSLHSLQFSDVGLELLTLNKGKEQGFIRFNRPVAYRCALEEAQTGFWEYFHKTKKGDGWAYLVGSSEWIKSFDDSDFIHYPNSQHFLFLVGEVRIDVISPDFPEFKVL